MTPATDDGGLTARLFMLSSGRLYGKPLKVTALAAIDSVNNKSNLARGLLFSHLLTAMRCRVTPIAMFSAPFECIQRVQSVPC